MSDDDAKVFNLWREAAAAMFAFRLQLGDTPEDAGKRVQYAMHELAGTNDGRPDK